MTVAGLLLAAGAGRRMGTPKALVCDDDGTPWLHRSLDALDRGGCGRLVVVLGAQADAASALVDAWRPVSLTGAVEVVVATDWDDGMGASLRRGLGHLLGVGGGGGAEPTTEAAVVSLVDLPDVGAQVVARVARSAAPRAGADAIPPRSVLARASYHGVAGHPVLLGANHWTGVIESAGGDRGARDYLAARAVRLIECGDLATGRDQDTPG